MLMKVAGALREVGVVVDSDGLRALRAGMVAATVWLIANVLELAVWSPAGTSVKIAADAVDWGCWGRDGWFDELARCCKSQAGEWGEGGEGC